MPLPTPGSGQSKKDWDSSCMGNDAMVSEYSDEKQRYAVCQSIWKKAKSKKDNDMNNIERRVFPVTEIRINRGVDGHGDKLVGYPAMFNRMSEDLGGFKEKIEPGAFKKTIKSSDVRALFNHDRNFVLGRTTNDTLKLKEDRDGLYMECFPPDTQWARDLKVSVDRGDVTQMSFGFSTITDRWETKDEENIRTLEEVELFDVSVVTFPAYPDTSVALRSMEEWRDNIKKEDPPDPTVGEEKIEEPMLPDKAAIRQRELELKRKGRILLEDTINE